MSNPSQPGRGRRQPNSRRKGSVWSLLLALLILAGCALGAYTLWQGLKPPIIQYRSYQLEAYRDVPASRYDLAAFQSPVPGRVEYERYGQEAKLGVDVSYYQPQIDWETAKAAGVEFAILRLGYRGYESGELHTDVCFEDHYRNAAAAGVEVGVYFFSQAMTAEEAVEEADYVLQILDGRPLDYPVVFDWEPMLPGQEARTDDATGESMTQCARAFSDRIREGGYEPMVYFNQEQGYLQYDLSQLADVPFWLAQYSTPPDFYYEFDLWQYSDAGEVEGIKGKVDLNLDMRPVQN